MESLDNHLIDGGEISPNWIIKAFNFLGGDPSTAKETAQEIEFYNFWKVRQNIYAAGAGALSASIPLMHIPALIADMLFLMHKMAYCSWVVGAYQKCTIEPKKDFGVILGMWSGAITEQALIASVGTGGLYMAGTTAAPIIATKGLPKFLTKQAIAQGVGQGTSLILGKGVPILTSYSTKIGVKAMSNASSLISGAAGKAAEKLTAKLLSKVSAKTFPQFFAGFKPFIGPIVAGGVNVWIMSQFIEQAEKYYKIKKEKG